MPSEIEEIHDGVQDKARETTWRDAALDEVSRSAVQSSTSGDAELFIQRELYKNDSFSLSPAERAGNTQIAEATEADKIQAKDLVANFVEKSGRHPNEPLTVIDPIEPMFIHRDSEASYPREPHPHELNHVEQLVYKQLSEMGYHPTLKGYDGGYTYRMTAR